MAWKDIPLWGLQEPLRGGRCGPQGGPRAVSRHARGPAGPRGPYFRVRPPARGTATAYVTLMKPAALLCLLAFSLVTLPACPEAGGPKPEAARGAADRWAQVEALVRQKEWEPAVQALEAMRTGERDDPEVILRLAEVRRLQGEQAKAILLLRGTLERQPDAAVLYLPLANLYLMLGDTAGAQAVLLRGREAGADAAQIALTLGTCLGRMDDGAGALVEFARAREAGADARLVRYNEALVLGQLGRRAESREAFEEVVRLDPAWAPGRRELARAMIEGAPEDRAGVERALDMLVAVSAELPEDWRVHETIGDAWLLLGDYDAAILSYTEALRLGQNPKSVEERYVAAVRRKREAAAADESGAR